MSREKSIEGMEIIDLDDCFKHQFQGLNRRMKDIWRDKGTLRLKIQM